MVTYVLFSINAYGGSNYYIIINDTTFDYSESFDYRINSLGGRINHVFPPNEFICYLPEKMADKILKHYDCNIEGLNTTELNLADKLGYQSWKHLISGLTDTVAGSDNYLQSADLSFKC